MLKEIGTIGIFYIVFENNNKIQVKLITVPSLGYLITVHSHTSGVAWGCPGQYKKGGRQNHHFFSTDKYFIIQT